MKRNRKRTSQKKENQRKTQRVGIFLRMVRGLRPYIEVAIVNLVAALLAALVLEHIFSIG
jgi:hypothetical protein